MHRYKKHLAIVITTLCLLFSSSSALAYDVFQRSCQAAAGSSTCDTARQTTTNPVYSSIHTAANIVALIAGIAAVIIIILAGLNLVTSGGNSEGAAKARKRIVAALVGLIIVALAWSLVIFVIGRVIK